MKAVTICLMILLGYGSVQGQKVADSALLASMPPLPAIDTADVPADELTTEIRKMLLRTNVMTASLEGLKALLTAQRNADNRVPKAFYDRFTLQVENGRIARLLENMVIKVYRATFTVADIREINKFYDTPVGKKLASQMVNIMGAARAEGEKLGQYMGLETARELIKEGKWK